MSNRDALLANIAGPERTPRARPAGLYASFASAGDLMFSSGVVGRENGTVISGQLQDAACVPRGERAAVAAVVAILRAAQEDLGSLDRIVKVVSLVGYLNTASNFGDHVKVLNAASAAISTVLPRTPLPARTAVGVATLPGDGAVEVSMVLQVQPGTPAS